MADIPQLIKDVTDDVLATELENRGWYCTTDWPRTNAVSIFDLIEEVEQAGYVVLREDNSLMEIYEALHLGAPDAMDKIKRYVELTTGRII